MHGGNGLCRYVFSGEMNHIYIFSSLMDNLGLAFDNPIMSNLVEKGMGLLRVLARPLISLRLLIIIIQHKKTF